MRICNLKVKNYRTFEDINISFKHYYSAICGQNDAGKSNIVRILRSTLNEDNLYGRAKTAKISTKRDFPKWLEVDDKDRKISVSIDFIVVKASDAGLYEFLNTYLGLSSNKEELNLSLNLVYEDSKLDPEVSVVAEGKHFDSLQAQEVHSRLQPSILIHNSTEFESRPSFTGFLREFSEEFSKELENMSSLVNKSLKKIVKDHRKEISDLLAKLNSKIKVGVSLPNFSFDRMPYNLTLGDSKVDIDLNEWGSGTRNRTMILLTLLKARQISESYISASKLTPILIIEEPESFLHPSAQAEFGGVLQQLSNDFGVQVITTTHSPYMLNQHNPESNILLERKTSRKQLRESTIVNTSGENWMEPFGLILGIANEEFRPWRDLFFSETKSLLLVEGEIDREYFELLRKEEHGGKRLSFDGDIFNYDGCSTLQNPTLLKFIKNRCKSVVITFDLDVSKEIEPVLQRNGFEKNKSYVAVGKNEPGKRCIEGLLPEKTYLEVNNQNPDLIQQVIHGDRNEQKSAKSSLKRGASHFRRNSQMASCPLR